MTSPAPLPQPAQILQLDWGMTAASASRFLSEKSWSELQNQYVPHASGQTCSSNGRFLDLPVEAYLSFDRCGAGSGLDEVVIIVKGPGGMAPTSDQVLDLLRDLHLRFSRKYDQYSWDEFAQLKDAGFIPEPYRCYHWYDARKTGGTDIMLAILGNGCNDTAPPQIVICYRSPAWAASQCAFSSVTEVAASTIAACTRIIPPPPGSSPVKRPMAPGPG